MRYTLRLELPGWGSIGEGLRRTLMRDQSNDRVEGCMSNEERERELRAEGCPFIGHAQCCLAWRALIG